MKTKILFIIVLFILLSGSIFAQTNSAEAAVASFYKFDRTQADIFNARAVSVRKNWFSAELNRLFQYELKREKEFFKKSPDEKPEFGDGFPIHPFDECFKNNRSYRNDYKVGTAELKSRGSAVVEVKYYSPKVCGSALIDTYKVEVVNSNGKWLIDNWIFPDGHTLVEVLNRKEY